MVSVFRNCRFLAPILTGMLYLGCAAHPSIADHTLEKGEEYAGYSLSTENLFPVLFYRYGLSDVSDIGLRLGVPIYGSGIDYSRTLFEQGKKRDVLNLGWSYSPNSNYDFTYYKFRDGRQKGSTMYWAFRAMLIPNGSYSGSGQSTRIGFLMGMFLKSKLGIEAGYFHDFASMPLTKIYVPSWNEYIKEEENQAKYGRFTVPHVSPGGWPTQHSRLVGLSLRVTFPFGAKTEEVEEQKEQ
ncbi:MAG: hypothetical protein VX822_01060 [Candidatus Neomarinimicrobiota bacterium]|nr:hypothetical protein [Candidatus Neomarinimicrobiota bacterium]